MSVPDTPDTAPSPRRAPFGMVPHAIARDPNLSPDAKLLWILLDGHAGEDLFTRVRQETLAHEMGLSPTSLRRVKRAVAELVEYGLILVERTGRSNVYRVLNPARMSPRELMSFTAEHAQKQRKQSQRVTSDRADSHLSDRAVVSPLHKKNPLSKNKALEEPPQGQEPALVAEAAVAAAGDLQKEQKPSVEPFLTERFLASLPDHLRPKETPAVAEAVVFGARRGWEPELLAARIAEEIPNRNAGPGLAVTLLRQFCQQPPAEFFGISGAPVSQRVQREPWCGLCDERSRLRETAQGALERCTACHPLRVTSGQISPLEGSSLTAEESAGDGAQYAEMIRADLRARSGSHDDTEALLEELTLAEPAEALTASVSVAKPAAEAVIA